MNTNPIVPGQPQRTDPKAIWSLVLGVLSLTCFWILTGIPAIILGHISRSDIRKSLGQLKGEGMALAGLIMGYISVAALPVILIVATIAIPGLLRARQDANESAAIATLKSINAAEISYLSTKGRYGDLKDLVDAQLLDESFFGTKFGYTYTVTASGAEYVAEANPATPNAGRYGYYSTVDAVVRYSREPDLAPDGQAGLAVD
jgi:type II secretory pathway pseudopilin PulG